MTEVVVATRSAHKLREIADLLSDLPGIRIVDLDAAGVPASPDEDDIEAFETFEANALAKARYYAARSGRAVLADDSGLCVDALGGAPGVHSKRFSGRGDLTGKDLDEANNARLLRDLEGVPIHSRGASYECALALVGPHTADQTFRGTVSGQILEAPRGEGGFGYDPLFFLPELGATFAEISPRQKNALSHRGRALRAARDAIATLAANPPRAAPKSPSVG